MLLAGLLVLAADPAWASGGGAAMPWEDKLTAIADSVTGPVARAIGVIAIALFGIAVAVSEGGSMVRRGCSVLFGLAIAFTASSFFLPWLGFTSGAVF
ncbi:MAG: TrbC/VirB2 family protein [Caulobacter sp.]|nr:TrbC/VirB2 family protein [Caulobacter sp.]